MKVNIDIDDRHEDTSITIQAKEWTKELEDIVSMIKKRKPQRLFGISDEQTVLLDPSKIDYIYAENRKVFAVMGNKRLEIKMKLYEVEEALAGHDFMRFSKSVIGNINQIQRFELSFNGNLCVFFQSENKEYITRKYVAPIKEKLATGGMD
ncbi:LytTR family DNA-binding domain-containing protein [Virgibacillus sp. W0181]|uniref:LytTR family DNA-binding domain-containing protein n=1 Tax=Virgibacillus sp. W0181 TaxID=3391581 RepID=UPI003F45A26A